MRKTRRLTKFEIVHDATADRVMVLIKGVRAQEIHVNQYLTLLVPQGAVQGQGFLGFVIEKAKLFCLKKHLIYYDRKADLHRILDCLAIDNQNDPKVRECIVTAREILWELGTDTVFQF